MHRQKLASTILQVFSRHTRIDEGIDFIVKIIFASLLAHSTRPLNLDLSVANL